MIQGQSQLDRAVRQPQLPGVHFDASVLTVARPQPSVSFDSEMSFRDVPPAPAPSMGRPTCPQQRAVPLGHMHTQVVNQEREVTISKHGTHKMCPKENPRHEALMYHFSGRTFHCAADCSCRNVAEVESLQHKFYDLQHKQEKLERALAMARPLTEEFQTPTKESRHRKVPTDSVHSGYSACTSYSCGSNTDPARRFYIIHWGQPNTVLNESAGAVFEWS